MRVAIDSSRFRLTGTSTQLPFKSGTHYHSHVWVHPGNPGVNSMLPDLGSDRRDRPNGR
jgi:hypothetical protein